MKAAFYERQGPASEVLQIAEVPTPTPGPGEVLVRIRASGVNPSDVKGRDGLRSTMDYPRIIPHSDGAGVIEAVGDGVPSRRVGEPVWTYNAQYKRPFGTAAEFVALSAHQAVPLPHGTAFAAAACWGIPAMTAHRVVFADGPVGGQTVLVTGGAGSVGNYAIQLAKRGGARVVTTVSSPEKAAIAKAAGADLVLNYRQNDWAAEVADFSNGAVDRIVDVDFGANLPQTQNLLRLGGTIASYASAGERTPMLPFYPLMSLNATLRFVLVYNMDEQAREQAIADITRFEREGSLVHNVARRVPLSSIATAHEIVEQGGAAGNVVVDVT